MTAEGDEAISSLAAMIKGRSYGLKDLLVRKSNRAYCSLPHDVHLMATTPVPVEELKRDALPYPERTHAPHLPLVDLNKLHPSDQVCTALEIVGGIKWPKPDSQVSVYQSRFLCAIWYAFLQHADLIKAVSHMAAGQKAVF